MGVWNVLRAWLRPPKPQAAKEKTYIRVAFTYGDSILWLLGSNVYRESRRDDVGPDGGHVQFDELVGPTDTLKKLYQKFGDVTKASRNTLYLSFEDGLVHETLHKVVLSQFTGMLVSNGMGVMDKPSFVFCGPVDKTPMRLSLQPT